MDRTITVRGVGTVSVKPDFIAITLNIVSKDMEYSKSVENANARIGLLQKAVVSSGFVKEELKTLSFNVSTNYEGETDEHGRYRNVFAGYVCRYTLKLSFDMDARKLAETLTAISESGANAEFSIKFTVKEPERVSAELLRSAAENARQKAEVLCEASGAKLGTLVKIDYDWTDINVFSPSTYKMEMERGVAAGVPEFEPEDIKSSDSAAFIWEIL
ncbi:MAG: SIMPL domain-containing protein [Oscillospiraceae bacterium]|nr:SIMPL domain-containing protein [Oscillospiraceae bacterium]